MSYAKDRRNSYGENDKSSRKSIPLRKRLVNKANRHAVQQRLDDATGPVDAERAEQTEVRLRGTRGKSWRKSPDRPLGQVLEAKRESADRSRRYKANMERLRSGDRGQVIEVIRQLSEPETEIVRLPFEPELVNGMTRGDMRMLIHARQMLHDLGDGPSPPSASSSGSSEQKHGGRCPVI